MLLRRLMQGLVTAVAVAVPIAASDGFYNGYAAPKIACLAIGSASLAGLLIYFIATNRVSPVPLTPVTVALCVYGSALAVVTSRSVDPLISLQGSLTAHMGLLAWLSFVVIALAVVAATHSEPATLKRLLLWIVATGCAVSIVGLGQLVVKTWTDSSAVVAGDESVRIYATLGHPDYAGNFLLFPLFLAIGLCSAVETRMQRVLCAVTAVLAALAILFSGTRGAWVGAGVGVLLGASLWWFRIRSRAERPSRRALAVAALAVVAIALTVAFTGLGATVRNRAAKFAAEGYTGAGRTTLWKFAAGMVPTFWLTGCGLETFRLAQIPFKTPDFERSLNGTAAEDPHSAFLSHVVATGIPVSILYLVVLGLAVRDLSIGIRRTPAMRDRFIGAGILCSLVATLVHDVFLHHMIADGMYLFLFVGLATAWRCSVTEGGFGAAAASAIGNRAAGRLVRVAAAVVCLAPLLAATVYVYRLLYSEWNIRACMAAAASGDDDLTRRYGNRATAFGLHQTDNFFLYGASLERLVDTNPRVDAVQRLELARAEVELAQVRNLTPVNSMVSSALLAVRLGKFDEAAMDLGKAEALDPISGLPQLGWASYHFNRGQLDEAVDRYAEARRRGIRYAQAEALQLKLREAVRLSPNRRRLKRLLRGE